MHSQYNELLFFTENASRAHASEYYVDNTGRPFSVRINWVPLYVGTIHHFLITVTRNSFRLIQDRTYVFEVIATKKYALTRIKRGNNSSVLLT